MKKIYKSTTGKQYTFPVKIDEKLVWVELKGDNNQYETSDAAVQAAIEDSAYLTSGKIVLSYEEEEVAPESKPAKSEKPKQEAQPAKSEKPLSLAEAATILEQKHGIAKAELKTAAEVRAWAKEKGLTVK
jgi:hypothetical protein